MVEKNLDVKGIIKNLRIKWGYLEKARLTPMKLN